MRTNLLASARLFSSDAIAKCYEGHSRPLCYACVIDFKIVSWPGKVPVSLATYVIDNTD